MTCNSSAFDIQKFLEQFPQFNDLNEFPQEVLDFWDSYSALFFNVPKWGRFYVQGRSLLLAHNLTLASMHGKVEGIMNNESVDSVSAGFDVQSIINKNGGLFNQTIYGIQYYKLSQIIGAGAFVVL